MLRLFSVPELRSLMHGTDVFDARAVWSDGRGVVFDASCAARVREQLTELLLRSGWARTHAFLQFCTALTVLPPDEHGQSLRHRPIRVYSVPPDAEGGTAQSLPTASTCGRTLYLAATYADTAMMRARFDVALDHMAGSGFGYA